MILQLLQVIDAYAYIANVAKSSKVVITTFQSQELAGAQGNFDPNMEREWIDTLAQRCVTSQMVNIITI